VGPEVDPASAKSGHGLAGPKGALKDVLAPGQLETFESGGHDRGLELCFQQSPGYSVGP